MKNRIIGAAAKLLFDFGLLKLWGKVPAGLRRRAVRMLVRLPARKGDVPPAMADPVFVVGLASSHTSLGWAARSAVAHIKSKGFSANVWNVSAHFGTDHKQEFSAGENNDAAALDGPGTLVLCVNPNQVAYALSSMPTNAVAGKRIIGYFVWEQEELPQSWLAASAFVDEIWAPSRFVAEAFIKAFPQKPVNLVEYDLAVPAGIKANRARFGLPAKHLVLVAANLESGIERKNLAGALAAYEQAFGDRDDVELVIKLHGRRLDTGRRAELVNAINRGRYFLIEEELSDEDMWSLIASCDTIFSMHRAEGYGLLMKQGLLLNKRVVATGWSGNVDFMAGDERAYLVDYKLVPLSDPDGIYASGSKARWAEPDIAHAAQLLKRARADALHAGASRGSGQIS